MQIPQQSTGMSQASIPALPPAHAASVSAYSRSPSRLSSPEHQPHHSDSSKVEIDLDDSGIGLSLMEESNDGKANQINTEAMDMNAALMSFDSNARNLVQ
jgi:hypothetical protein